MANILLIESAVSAIVEMGGAQLKHQTAGASVATAISALFADVNGSDDAFIEAFGNGMAPKAKAYKAGSLAEGVKAKIAKMAKDKREQILSILKVRLSEARKLRKLGGMPSKGESIQAALKRYQTPAEKQAKPEGNESHKVAIADDASMDDIADALSVWVAKHGSASAGLVAKLADFLPVSVRRSRKAA